MKQLKAAVGDDTVPLTSAGATGAGPDVVPADVVPADVVRAETVGLSSSGTTLSLQDVRIKKAVFCDAHVLECCCFGLLLGWRCCGPKA